MNKTILFDIDGTLIDTLHLYIQSYFKTIKNYPDIDMLTLDELEELNPTSEYRTIEKVVGRKRASEAYRIFLDNYRQGHDEYFRGIYPGVVPLLEKLRGDGFTLGLVTGKSKIAWDITSAKVQLGDFDVVITDNEVQNPKPHPEGLLQAMKILKVKPEDTKKVIYVGDSTTDLMAANEAGVVFGAAIWSEWANAEELISKAKKEGGLHFILKTPLELIDYM